MELDNEDVLLGMTIAAIILGIGLSMFFVSPYTGYGAVVLAIGMMTLALMITARPRVIERVKREVVLQPARHTEPTPITPPTFVIPSQKPSTQVSAEKQSEEARATTTVAESQSTHAEEATPPAAETPQTTEATPSQEVKSQETQTAESTQPQPEEKPQEKQQEEELTAPTPPPS